TTGSDSKKNRITDIACVIVKGGEIISEFESLVNPHQSIPPFISHMTGITYDMVINAPEANDVFAQISNIFQDKSTVFTAHNARFDFGFVNNTLERVGFEPISSPLLCTLKLARRLIPTKQRKNVGSLAEYFGIPVYNRHRAMGDASATAKFLIQLLEIAEAEHDITDIEDLLKFQNKSIRHFVAPSETQKRVEAQLELLPDSAGVYKFFDSRNKILYIGKAKCLKERVKSYFHVDTFTSKKIAQMFRQIHRIQWECTDSELEALLLESKLIKRHKPHYNTVDKKYKSYPFIKLTMGDEFPTIQTCNSIEADGSEYYGPMRSTALAEEIVRNVQKRFKIRKCEGKLKPSADKKPSFYYHIEQCYSPCSGKISSEDYRKEIARIQAYLSGVPDGLIAQLENQMGYYADNLEFEKAEKIKQDIIGLKKIFSRDEKNPNSLNESNFIVLTAGSVQEKTIELFAIKTGMLKLHKSIGRKSDLSELMNEIHTIYYNGESKISVFSKEDVDEIRIVSNWVHRQNGNCSTIYLEQKGETEIFEELEANIRNFVFESEIDDS
ncbi:DEDD exnuclease domain-containing protein, partial [Bacteroidetes/Chlorobi group bacterium ChocPot_Mid]